MSTSNSNNNQNNGLPTTVGDISLVGSVFTTLYTPFYLAHESHVKVLGQTSLGNNLAPTQQDPMPGVR